METFNDVLDAVLQLCRLDIAQTTYDLWFKNIEYLNYEDNTFYLKVKNEMCRRVLADNYMKLLKESFCRVMSFDVNIELMIDTDRPISIQNDPRESFRDTYTEQTGYSASSIPATIKKCTFSNFIVGKCNTLANSAAMAVAAQPGIKYNPLFIYGNSGLGKTHLMFAIYNEIQARDPSAKIIYCSGEGFLSEMLQDIRNKTMESFKNKYRSVDVLLIDDIQYIQKTEAIQEEFFNTFNALAGANKQIVMTSDIPPKQMERLDDRLRTRFEQGLIADVKPPDLDLRKAILKVKCDSLGIKLSDANINVIAEKIKNNVRQLEGVVNKIEAMFAEYGSMPSADEIDSIITEITTDSRPISEKVEAIMQECAKTFGVSVEDMKSQRKEQNIVTARKISMYAMKCVLELSNEKIGSYFNRTHPTVIHDVRSIKEKMEKDRSFNTTVTNIISKFNSFD